MGHYFKKLKRLGIPLYAYSSTVSFVLLCLCIIILVAFFFVSKEIEKTKHLEIDIEQIPKIVKYQIETQSAPLFALAESHIAKYQNLHDTVQNSKLRAEFVHVHAPTFRFSNQVYNIGYFLEDGTTIFFISLEHINRLGMTNSLSPELKNLIKSINPPQFSKYILFTSPPHDTSHDTQEISSALSDTARVFNVANQKGLLEFYGSHGELIEARTDVDFIDTTSFPYYAKTINARSPRISSPYISHLAKAPAVSLSYPIREVVQNTDQSQNAYDRFQDRFVKSEQVVKGVYAISLHFDPTLLHNEMISPEATIFILNDTLTDFVSIQPAPKDAPILARCNANTIINNTHIVHKHDPILLLQDERISMTTMMQDFLTFNREQGATFRSEINKVNFNGYDFDYYFTSAIVHGKTLNLLVWDRPVATISSLTFFDLGVFFIILALILIACNFYIIYKKTITVVALSIEARRLASYDFSAPPPTICHSAELISLHRSLATIRLILVDAFANSLYKSAIKFDRTEDEPKIKKSSIILPKEDLDFALTRLENDFINGKFTEEQYIQAKLYYKQKAIKEKTLLVNASNIEGPIEGYEEDILESEREPILTHVSSPSKEKDKKQKPTSKNIPIINDDEYNEEDFIREELVDGTYYIHRRETPIKENTLLPHSGMTPPVERRVEDRRQNTLTINFEERRKEERRKIEEERKALEERLAKSKEKTSSLVQQFDEMFSTNLLSSSANKKSAKNQPSLEQTKEKQSIKPKDEYNFVLSDAQFKAGIANTIPTTKNKEET